MLALNGDDFQWKKAKRKQQWRKLRTKLKWETKKKKKNNPKKLCSKKKMGEERGINIVVFSEHKGQRWPS